MLTRETHRLLSGRVWQVYAGGAGAPLLWLHGMTGVAADDPLLAVLGEHHRVHAPVAPGFADLAELAQIDDIRDLVLDYDDLLEALGLRTAVLVGHSFGAMVAAEIAAHCPHRAAALVLLSPVGLWSDAHPVADIFAQPAGEMDQLLWHDPAARERFRTRLADRAAGGSAAEQMITLVSSLAAVTKFLWPIPDKGLRKRLPRIAAPTLVVFGAEDRFVPCRYGEEFRAGLRHGAVALVPEAGHMVPYEKTHEVAGLVGDFLRSARAAHNGKEERS